MKGQRLGVFRSIQELCMGLFSDDTGFKVAGHFRHIGATVS